MSNSSNNTFKITNPFADRWRNVFNQSSTRPGLDTSKGQKMISKLPNAKPGYLSAKAIQQTADQNKQAADKLNPIAQTLLLGGAGAGLGYMFSKPWNKKRNAILGGISAGLLPMAVGGTVDNEALQRLARMGSGAALGATFGNIGSRKARIGAFLGGLYGGFAPEALSSLLKSGSDSRQHKSSALNYLTFKQGNLRAAIPAGLDLDKQSDFKTTSAFSRPKSTFGFSMPSWNDVKQSYSGVWNSLKPVSRQSRMATSKQPARLSERIFNR